MPTLVLSPRHSADSRALRAAALAAGWNVERLGGWRAPEHLRDQDVAVYGEALFVEVIAAQLNVAVVDVPAAWLPGLPARHRGRRVETCMLGAARALAGPVFVKPADGRKGFESAVYTGGAGLPDAEVLPDATPVLVADPVHWEVEFRTFVLEGQMVAVSPYLRAGALAVGENGQWHASGAELSAATAYAAAFVAEADLPPAVVVDIGLISGYGWAVVEANCAWGAGLCGCDPRRVLDVVARACRPRARLTAADARWVASPLDVDTGGPAT